MMRFLTPIVAAALLLAPVQASLAQPGGPAKYDQLQSDYEQAMADYQQALARYEKDRAEYDRRFGRGAYDRRYGAPQPPAPPPPTPKPIPKLPPQPRGPAFVPDDGPPYLGQTCSRRPETNRAGLAAAMAGSLGSGPPTTSSRSEGAVLGALIEGTLGANLAAGPNSALRYAPECDGDGFYFTSDQTFPYREPSGPRRGRNGRYDERAYVVQGCRLAVAPIVNRSRGVEYHYARVCPDRRGRLRFAD